MLSLIDINTVEFKHQQHCLAISDHTGGIWCRFHTQPITEQALTYLLCLGTNILMGSDAPKKEELVEAAYYILVDAYYCLVPVNEHEQ